MLMNAVYHSSFSATVNSRHSKFPKQKDRSQVERAMLLQARVRDTAIFRKQGSRPHHRGEHLAQRRERSSLFLKNKTINKSLCFHIGFKRQNISVAISTIRRVGFRLRCFFDAPTRAPPPARILLLLTVVVWVRRASCMAPDWSSVATWEMCLKNRK